MNIDYSKLKSIYSFNDGVFDGGLIKDTLDSRKMMSSFIYHISASCKTKYGKIFDKTWGFAWPSNAKRCLRKMGYNNVKLHWGYDEDKVLKSLENGCPIFISATSKVINGHAWVIDGYIKRFYKQNPDSALKSQTLVHCNWGRLLLLFGGKEQLVASNNSICHPIDKKISELEAEDMILLRDFSSMSLGILYFEKTPENIKEHTIMLKMTTDDGDVFENSIKIVF